MLQAEPPDPEKIPKGDVIGATAVFMSCFYKEHQFFREGNFFNNEYIDPELKIIHPCCLNFIR
jgi:histone chaperone ASF1